MKGLSFAYARECFETALVEGGYKASTVKQRLRLLAVLYSYLAQAGTTDLRTVDRAIMLGYLRHLGERVTPSTGRRLQESTKKAYLAVARLFFRSLHERGLILTNPLRGVALVERESPRRKVVLSEGDVAILLDSIDVTLPYGFRDRALLELVYSSGLRGGEVSALDVGDVNLEERLVHVREGKFAKDRTVPITELAAEMLAEFIRSRPVDAPVFRGQFGKRLRGCNMNVRFKELACRAGVYRDGVTLHSLRHACATHLLAHGADIRYVQGLLGHKSVQTTVTYTNELVEDLRRRYVRGHPRENAISRTVDPGYEERLRVLVHGLRKAKRKRDTRARKGLQPPP